MTSLKKIVEIEKKKRIEKLSWKNGDTHNNLYVKGKQMTIN